MIPPLRFVLLSLLLLSCVRAEAIKVFDGSKREVLYQTSSHAGQRELQELLRMVPGGEGMTVSKMPCSWRRNEEGVAKIRSYPVIVARLGNHFDPPFNLKKAEIPLSDAIIEKAMEEFDEGIKVRLERTQPKIWIGINGHYHQRDGIEEGKRLLDSAEVHRRWQKQNTNPRVVVLDTITPCYENYPLTVRSDHFHAGGMAGYVEGLEIVKALCAQDGIPVPEKLEAHVQTLLEEAKDKRDTFTITEPKNLDPKTQVKLGEKVTVRWTVDDPEVKAVYVMLHRLGHNDYFLSDRLDVGSPRFGSLTWTAKDDLPTVGNKVTSIGKVTPASAKKEAFKKKIPGGHKLFCFRIVNADDPSEFTFSDSFTIPF